MPDSEARIPRVRCLHELFEIQAERTPAAPAIVAEGRRVTYLDLNRRANQLARYLRASGVARETLVGVCLERSADAIVSLLAVMKAGGAYVPLDPSYPASRLALMLADCGAPVILTKERFADRVGGGARLICLDRSRQALGALDAGNLPNLAADDSAAYVIYTSGTMGQPKGVVGLHRAAVNRLSWMWRTYPFAAGEVCCHKTSLNFVDSVAELFGPLLCGIATVIVPDDATSDPARLAGVLGSSSVTRVVVVPSQLRGLLALDGLSERLAALRLCVSSGEALPLDLCRRFRERLPHAVLLNLYGSTEVAADATCYDTRQLPPDAMSVPIGRPIDETVVYVLDEARRMAAPGMAGELFVAGAGLARGYLNRDDLTAASFPPNPFPGTPSARMYRTGDRGRYLPDGNLEFLGRLDRQVKLRGMRVELCDVETAIAAHPDVAQAVVTARPDDAGELRLVAYVVPRDPSTRSIGHIRGFCRDRLPAHMVPSAFVSLPSLPLTPSGKLDARALPAPEPARADIMEGTFVAPRSPVEARLAAIWARLLGVKDVGVADDFFDLGGHSLLAVRLSAEIDVAFGRRLPASVLAEAPTIEKLAAVLARDEEAHPRSLLIDLQPSGSRRPFFLVHGIGGEVLSFAPLARRLAPDRPVYGIRAKGSDGGETPLADIESMAACYVEAVRGAAGGGPYLLGGYSSGGTVVLEMARQLHAQGEEVAQLVVIDGEAPDAGRPPWWDARAGGAYVRNLASWVVDDDFIRSPSSDKIARLRSKGRVLGSKLRSLVSSEDGSADIRDVLGVWRVPAWHRAFLETHAQALERYRPRPYDGAITLIRARTIRLSAWAAPDLGWAGLARGGLDIRMVPGAHDNILAEPRVRVLADQLRECLNRAEARAAYQR
jgi:amino acid adenylation domain-containing protein